MNFLLKILVAINLMSFCFMVSIIDTANNIIIPAAVIVVNVVFLTLVGHVYDERIDDYADM